MFRNTKSLMNLSLADPIIEASTKKEFYLGRRIIISEEQKCNKE